MSQLRTAKGFFVSVTTTTVFLMFVFIRHVLPTIEVFLLQVLEFSPFASYGTQIIGTVGTSMAVYSIIQKGLTKLWRFRFVRRWGLEHIDIEGTWVGYYHVDSDYFLAVDHYRQSIGTVGITGCGYDSDGTKVAS